MDKLFKISKRNTPSIYDSNTIYSSSEECTKCGRHKTDISVLGAYLPTFNKSFGLIKPLGGIIGSKEAIKYLKDNNLHGFSIEEAVVTFGRRGFIKPYFRIKPNYEIELNGEKGPGPVIKCNQCNVKGWNDKIGIHIVKNLPPGDLFVIQNTWVLLCSERFMKIAKSVPDKCYLTFEQWDFNLEKPY